MNVEWKDVHIILFQPGKRVTIYCVPSHLIVSAFCFVLFSSTYTLSSFAPTAAGGKIHCCKPANIHYYHLLESNLLFQSSDRPKLDIKLTLLNYSSLRVVERSAALPGAGVYRYSRT